MKREELLEMCNGSMIVNKEVARLLPNKTMTRRVITNQDVVGVSGRGVSFNTHYGVFSNHIDNFTKDNAKHQIGDILWVREPAKVTAYHRSFYDTKIDYQLHRNNKHEYRIDVPLRFLPNPKRWITGCLSVPNGCIREMARLFVKITNVRIERLQDIADLDIIQEGWSPIIDSKVSMSDWFASLWDTTAKSPCQWGDNPYVFVYEWEYIEYD